MQTQTTRAASAWVKTGIGLVLTALMLFPLYWMVNVSFTERDAIRSGGLFPKAFTLDHYRVVLQDQLPYLGTSLVIGIGTVALTLLVSAPAGYAMSSLFVPGRRVLNFCLIVAQMVPGVVMALGFYTVYTDLGILDTVPGLIVADSTIAIPFGVMLFSAFMAGIPRDLLHAAAIDGANH
jgi:multiple sugar transport system permease protein